MGVVLSSVLAAAAEGPGAAPRTGAGADPERTAFSRPKATVHIFIVEDEKKVASFLQRGLAEEHYEVDVVHDGDAGLERALETDYDLVVLDVMLPGRDGLGVPAGRSNLPMRWKEPKRSIERFMKNRCILDGVGVNSFPFQAMAPTCQPVVGSRVP